MTRRRGRLHHSQCAYCVPIRHMSEVGGTVAFTAPIGRIPAVLQYSAESAVEVTQRRWDP